MSNSDYCGAMLGDSRQTANLKFYNSVYLNHL
jgi:hypothetical protein